MALVLNSGNFLPTVKLRLPQEVTAGIEFVEVTAGNKLAVIQDSAAGTLSITIVDPNG